MSTVSNSPSLRADHRKVSLPGEQVEAGSAQAQGSAGAVDVSCCQTHVFTAFQTSSRLRADCIRLDEDLTPQQTQQRRGLSADFQCLKARGYKPFFRGATLKYQDGPVIRKCARGEANKPLAAAAQAAWAAAPPAVRRPHPQRTSLAEHPSEVLYQSGITMVNGTLGPLTATEAGLFNDVVGEICASDGGI